MIRLLQKTIFNTFIFKIAFLVFAFAYIFPFTINFSEKSVKVFLVWGIVLISYYLFACKDMFINKSYIFIYIFLFLVCLSVIFNPNKINSFKLFLYLIIQIIIPLIFDKKENQKSLHKELLLINYLVIIISFLISLSSLFIYIINFRSSIIVNSSEYLFGMQEGRLYGILGNPNSGSLIAYVSIIISFLALVSDKKNQKKKNSFLNCVIIINIIIQLFILFLGNSRSTLIIFSISISIIIYFTYCKIYKQLFLCIIKFSILLIIVFFAVVFISKFSNKVTSYFPGIYEYTKTLNIQKTENSDKAIKNTLDIIKKDSIENERIYNTKDNSNGRLGIWKIGFNVIKKRFIFGVGSENIKSEAIINEPTYYNKGILGNMHNIYIQILVGSGVFALISFILLLLNYLNILFKAIIQNNSSSKSIIIIFSLIIGLCIENIFDSNLIYFMFLAIVPIFWIYLNYGYQLSLKGVDYNEKDFISD